MEKPFFFKYKESNLFGTLFLPENNEIHDFGVVICDPFAEEKKSSQAVLVNLARIICKNDIPVLMFDYYGCGDSEGDFKDSSLSTWIDNTIGAINLVITYLGLKKVILLGLRLGGFIAERAAKQLDNVVELLLIEPVIKPSEYFKQILRQKMVRELKTFGAIQSSKDSLMDELNKKNIIDLDGYEITNNFYEDWNKYLPLTFNNSSIKRTIFYISYKRKLSKEYQDVVFDTSTSFKIINILPFWNKIDNCDCTNLFSEFELKFRKSE